MAGSKKKKLFAAGSWGLAKRLLKPVPVVGVVIAVGFLTYEIRKKGWLRGVLHVGLDVTPVVGTAKNVVEIFTGDLISDRALLPKSRAE